MRIVYLGKNNWNLLVGTVGSFFGGGSMFDHMTL